MQADYVTLPVTLSAKMWVNLFASAITAVGMMMLVLTRYRHRHPLYKLGCLGVSVGGFTSMLEHFHEGTVASHGESLLIVSMAVYVSIIAWEHLRERNQSLRAASMLAGVCVMMLFTTACAPLSFTGTYHGNYGDYSITGSTNGVGVRADIWSLLAKSEKNPASR